MKFPKHPQSRRAGVALIMVLILVGVSILILAGVMRRTESVAILNERNNNYVVTCNAAEAAVEKIYSYMAYDFQNQGLLTVTNNLSMYRGNIPGDGNSYWSNFQFSDGQGNSGKTYVNYAYTYSGNLPSAYPGLFTTNAPVYRIVSNVVRTDSRYNVVGTAQEDVLLAMVPLSNWAIFYNGRLEFTQCATMIVNGSVFANGDIYVGTSASLTFSLDVGTAGTLSAPGVDGLSSYGTNQSSWNTIFNATPAYTINKPSLTVSLNMTNSHFLIDIPPSGEDSMSVTGQQRLYNKAQMILIVTNSSVGGTPTVLLTLQNSLNGDVPGNDSSKAPYTYTNATAASLSTNLPFLSLTNTFTDQREGKTALVTQIDVGQYSTWVATNSRVQNKLSASSGIYPTILYVADRRKATASQLPVVRVSNSAQLPANNNIGFSIATPNPLYTWGDYNTQISSSGSQSTQNNNPDNKVPAALLSDSLTILSSSWTDSQSYTTYSSGNSSLDASANTTINAAIVTGTMPSTGTSATTFSGGVHNLPRLLEDWANKHLYLNTSIIRLWDSNMATNQFRNPGNFGQPNPYYDPPTRHYTFDTSFLDPTKVAPGIPVVLFPIRFAWCVPPPNIYTYTPAHN